MKRRYIFVAGAAYGLLMRLIFGMAPFLNQGYRETASGPMMTSFVLLTPLMIGIYTVYAARERKPTLGFALGAPWVPTLVFVGGTALLLIEGSICIAMALPIFLFTASAGGVIGLLLSRYGKFKSSTMNA